MTTKPLSDPPLRSNVPELSVSELALSLKRTLEDSYARVRVRGELGRVTIPKSGHLYTDLKDADAVINAICWKGTIGKLSIKPEEGLEVICTGRITTYPARSNYQLIIESMELAGAGALLKMLEDRRKKLENEGLFAAERKKTLPFLPEVVGVVTSPTGAVIRDIMHRLNDRFPRHVLLWPVQVQGPGAAEQIAQAIKGFDSLQPGKGVESIPRPDVLIVARGGGSLEDLMPFNEEIVVRAAASCSIPLISAVGHETDTTLIDYAADLRAPTPTAAAERAVPVRMDLLTQLASDARRLIGAGGRIMGEKRQRLETLRARLGTPQRLLDIRIQRLDHTGERLTLVFEKSLSYKHSRAAQLAARLRHPRLLVAEKTRTLVYLRDHLTRLAPRLLYDPRRRLDHAGRMLESLSFKSVLARGYAVIEDEKGRPVTNSARLHTGENVQIRLRDGKTGAIITETKA